MAMIQCPECNQSVSSVANACPQCGFGVSRWIQENERRRLDAQRVKQRNKFFLLMLAAFGGISFLFCGLGTCAGGDSNEGSTSTKAAQQIASKEKEKAISAFQEQRDTLGEKITALGQAGQSQDWERAAALDTEILTVLNSVDRFPNVEGRDQLKADARKARLPLSEHRLKEHIEAGRLEEAKKLHTELLAQGSAAAEEMGRPLKLALAEDHLVKFEAAQAKEEWIDALLQAQSGLLALEGIQDKESETLVKKLKRAEKSVSTKAKKAQEFADQLAAEQGQFKKDCAGKSDCLMLDNRILWDDYHANEVAADQKYKGRTLIVSGRVDSIDKNFLDELVVRLRSSNPYMTTMAELDKEQEDVAARLRKGAEIDMRCTGGGMVVGSPVLRKCWVLRYGR